ncbi:MAG: 1-acyl-sn-glycerol-3-phosphate acyltransferase [Prevotellaceae bacterium]|jgi:1-acyl-sn-glycerol-3-phosphate acyltransferase|nr:1-acyl-sn-glycerol-3-phosphate acyltransferase [Prevotellaceae bacterium]
MKRVHDFDLAYLFVKPYVNFCFKQYYGSITIEGKENLPKNSSFILAPNHQNALMDAIAMLMTQPGQPVFLARGDIFGNKTVNAILYFLNILPIYRIRDGMSELSKNNEVFEQSIQVLKDGVTLCLMPEGQQSFKRSLLPLVKGMFRIAFAAQKAMNNRTVEIVPVGIDYGDYLKAGNHLIIRFGKPVNVKNRMEKYDEYPAKALNEIRNELYESMDNLSQNVRSKIYYDEFYAISTMFDENFTAIAAGKNRAVQKLENRRAITKILDEVEKNEAEKISKLMALFQSYRTLLLEYKLSDYALKQEAQNFFAVKNLLLLIFFPLAIIGFIINAIPAFAPKIVTRRVKDTSFLCSFSYVLHMITFPIYYLILIIAMSLTFLSCLQSLATAVLSLAAGKISLIWLCRFKQIAARWKFIFFELRNRNEALQLKEKRKEIRAGLENTDIQAKK